MKCFRIATEEEYKATLQKIPDYEIQEEDVSIGSTDDIDSIYNIVDSISHCTIYRIDSNYTRYCINTIDTINTIVSIDMNYYHQYGDVWYDHIE